MNLILKSESASLCEKVTNIQTSDGAVVICRAPNSHPLVGSHLIECRASFKNEVSAGTQVNALFLVRLPCGDSCYTQSAMKTKWRLELVYLRETNEWMISLRENFGWLVYTQTVILMYKNHMLNPQTNEELIVHTPVLAINLKALKATTLAHWFDRRVRVTRSNQAGLDIYVDALGTMGSHYVARLMLLDMPQFVEIEVTKVRSPQFAVMSRLEKHAYRQKIFTTVEEFHVLYCAVLLTNCMHIMQTSNLPINETLHISDPRIRSDFVVVAIDSTVDSDHSHGTVVHIFSTRRPNTYYDRLRVKQINIFERLNGFGSLINMFNVNKTLDQQDTSLLALEIPRAIFKHYGVHRASIEYEVRHQVTHFTVELHLKIKKNGSVHYLPLYDQRDDTMVQSRTFIYGTEFIRLMDGTWHGAILGCETRIMSQKSLQYMKKVLRSSLIQLHTPYSKIQILLDGIKPLKPDNGIVRLERQVNLTCISDTNIGSFSVRWFVQLTHSRPAGSTQTIRTGTYGTSQPGQSLNLSLPYLLTLEEEIYKATCVLYAPGARLPNPSSVFIYFSLPTLNYNHHWTKADNSWILQHVVFGSVTVLIILLVTAGPILAVKLAGVPLDSVPQFGNRFLQSSTNEPLLMRYILSNPPQPPRTSTLHIMENSRPAKPLNFDRHDVMKKQPRAKFSMKRNKGRRKLRPVSATVISRRTCVSARSHRYQPPKRTIELKPKSARHSPETNFILNICKYFINVNTLESDVLSQ
ncbi:hypothetical protein P879_06149 [Paragonimus westermani]|uniref:Uncharacterized protein n=1 Tax=Paragonimus westermani TaxID=34504 RepID=A0A8T0DFM8_9TREM|nr:hypothetical protein P879_06149 [Paragonimus westermani]